MSATTCPYCGLPVEQCVYPRTKWELVFQKAGACWPSDHHDGLFYAKYIETGASDYKTTEWQATPDMLLQWLTENAR